MIELTPDDIATFRSRVTKTETCWLYRTPNRWAYGSVTVHGAGRTYSVPAHRFSWALHVGPIPDGRLVLHHCDVHACVRPNHLFVGTQADNIADMIAKGRDGWTRLRND